MYKVEYKEIINVEVEKKELRLQLGENGVKHYCWTKRGMETIYNKYEIAIQLGDYGVVVKNEISVWQMVKEKMGKKDDWSAHMVYQGNGSFVEDEE